MSLTTLAGLSTALPTQGVARPVHCGGGVSGHHWSVPPGNSSGQNTSPFRAGQNPLLHQHLAAFFV